MLNVVNGQTYFKNLKTVIFSKYVWPFYNVMQERVKLFAIIPFLPSKKMGTGNHDDELVHSTTSIFPAVTLCI